MENDGEVVGIVDPINRGIFQFFPYTKYCNILPVSMWELVQKIVVRQS
jgi:hypothetical protein